MKSEKAERTHALRLRAPSTSRLFHLISSETPLKKDGMGDLLLLPLHAGEAMKEFTICGRVDSASRFCAVFTS
jgi:hypothetical protein